MMGLPLFNAANDPGPDFFNLISASGHQPFSEGSVEDSAHATTVIAVRFKDGVVMVADRQATAQYVASRDTRKIEAADRYTAMAISGSAARGLQFIRIAQLSFEHYEKMTSSMLSLEGKANYLTPIIQENNFNTPLFVVPMLAGFDPNHGVGRIFEYDGAGGCYERYDFNVIGSGSQFAEGALRLGFTPDMELEAALELAAIALYEAGDNDPSTGGPDFVRGIYPIMVTLTKDGFTELDTESVGERFRRINDRRAQSRGIAGGQLR